MFCLECKIVIYVNGVIECWLPLQTKCFDINHVILHGSFHANYVLDDFLSLMKQSCLYFTVERLNTEIIILCMNNIYIFDGAYRRILVMVFSVKPCRAKLGLSAQ